MAHPRDDSPTDLGAPVGNKNAEKHGAYAAPSDTPVTLDEIIAQEGRSYRRLSDYLTRLMLSGEAEVDQIVSLSTTCNQMASRLGRLLKMAGRDHLDDHLDLDQVLDQVFGVEDPDDLPLH